MFDFLTHTYTFNATGIKMREKRFSTREAATQAMYKYMGKHHITLEKIYDDKHNKTYVCDHGIRFYIQRLY